MPHQAPSVFISYSQEDRQLCEALAQILANNGVSTWWDNHILPGQEFSDQIESHLSEASCVVVLWSRRAAQSEWVRVESDAAAARGILIPVRLDDTPLPLRFRLLHTICIVGNDGNLDATQVQRLISAIVTNDGVGTDHASAVTPVRTIPNVQAELIRLINENIRGERIFIGSSIPHDKLTNATTSFAIPANESVLVLIDNTLFGSSKNGAAFTTAALYFRDILKPPGRVGYDEFRNCTFRKKFAGPWAVVELTRGLECAVAPKADTDGFIRVLFGLREFLEIARVRNLE